jgi:hypothetical protein
LQTTSGTSLNLWDSFYRESVRGRVEALLTARTAAHLASLQVEMSREIFYRDSVRCRVEALLRASGAAHLDSLQVEMRTKIFYQESVCGRVEVLLTARRYWQLKVDHR